MLFFENDSSCLIASSTETSIIPNFSAMASCIAKEYGSAALGSIHFGISMIVSLCSHAKLYSSHHDVIAIMIAPFCNQSVIAVTVSSVLPEYEQTIISVCVETRLGT